LTSKTLKFASEHVAPIMEGRKWQTIRVGRDEQIRPGNFLDLVEADSREVFATAKADRVVRAPADWIASQESDGHRNYRSTGQLLDHLREYYPEEYLSPQRELSLIAFPDPQQAPGYDLELDPREPRPEEVAYRGE